MKRTVTYRTIIEKDGKYYHGYVPALPGCHTQGLTIEETQANLREAMAGYIESLKAHNEPIPQEKEQIETVISVDFDDLSQSKPLSYA